MGDLINSFSQNIGAAPHLAFVAAFLSGIVASLTPCVYPMIPVTIAFIGGRSAGGGRRTGFFLSISYVMGLAVSYSILGAAAALMGKMFGAWASHPAVYAAMGIIFAVFGLSMLDVFTIPMPGFLTSLAPKKGASGIPGAFAVGAASAFVAAPCTAPIVFAILTLVAKGGNVLYGFSLLFTFALGMGLLLVVVGTFAGALANLPKSGMWMVKVKKGFGVLMLAVAGYFIFNAAKLF